MRRPPIELVVTQYRCGRRILRLARCLLSAKTSVETFLRPAAQTRRVKPPAEPRGRSERSTRAEAVKSSDPKVLKCILLLGDLRRILFEPIEQLRTTSSAVWSDGLIPLRGSRRVLRLRQFKAYAVVAVAQAIEIPLVDRNGSD